jgi:hypothetical protein
VVEKSGHSIVMVNFNYPVELRGFLASERVREDGAVKTGLLGQWMLLRWVKTHIATVCLTTMVFRYLPSPDGWEFGGNPNHVVIHRASAGAGSVATHLAGYGGRNDHLSVGGMAEAIFFLSQPFVSELEYQFDQVLSQTDCVEVTSAWQMACLRSKDTAVLEAANYA